MYYHQIDFFTQSKFFIISFIAGVLSSFFALILCSKVISKKLKYISDVLFCLISLLIFVCTNIAFQDAALRHYEIFAFVFGLIISVFVFKKKTDIFIEKFYQKFFFPLFSLIEKEYKFIINKLKTLLKKVRSLLYNLISKIKELFFNNAKSKRKKQKEKSEPTPTA